MTQSRARTKTHGGTDRRRSQNGTRSLTDRGEVVKKWRPKETLEGQGGAIGGDVSGAWS